MADVQIRSATLSDLETIVGYNLALAIETEDKDLDKSTLTRGVEQALTRSDLARYFVAELDGQVIAQTMVTMEWSDWRNGSFWWIQSVYVDAANRGQGVFKSIYEYLEGLAKDDDACCGLRLYVELENEAAIRTYEKLGMKRTHYHLYES